ncbi:hypothetical protein CEXT_108221 [Caerostris extrusa]|uniref:Uncharacterized protein n=1 Tax=Caerostris extrusa TaxID=172846 RepID=A0AAV4RXJ2_CAEEX|nr:hypothetical protein CEXT_108221 [Caerostris extrusa]
MNLSEASVMETILRIDSNQLRTPVHLLRGSVCERIPLSESSAGAVISGAPQERTVRAMLLEGAPVDKSSVMETILRIDSNQLQTPVHLLSGSVSERIHLSESSAGAVISGAPQESIGRAVLSEGAPVDKCNILIKM